MTVADGSAPAAVGGDGRADLVALEELKPLLVKTFYDREDELEAVVEWTFGERLKAAFAGPDDTLNKIIHTLVNAARERELTAVFLGAVLSIRPDDRELWSVVVRLVPEARQQVREIPRSTTGAIEVLPQDLVCLLDRSDQDIQIGKLIEWHCESRSKRPIFAILPGDPRESHNDYLHRLQHWTLPEKLTRRKLPSEVLFYSINARGGDLQSFVAATTDTFEDKLGVDDQASVPQELRKRRCGAFVLSYSLRVSEWAGDAKAALDGMRSYWQGFPDLEEHPLLVFVLSVRFEDLSESGFTNLLARRARRKRRELWKEAIAALTAGTAERLKLHGLPELGPVTRGDVDAWLQRPEVKARLRRGVDEKWIAKLFDGEQSAPMDDVAQELQDFLEGVTDKGKEN